MLKDSLGHEDPFFHFLVINYDTQTSKDFTSPKLLNIKSQRLGKRDFRILKIDNPIPD